MSYLSCLSVYKEKKDIRNTLVHRFCVKMIEHIIPPSVYGRQASSETIVNKNFKSFLQIIFLVAKIIAFSWFSLVKLYCKGVKLN